MMRCGTCGSGTLILTGMGDHWSLCCSQGHKWVADRATVVVIKQNAVDLERELERILDQG